MAVKNLSHRYDNSSDSIYIEFMYYHGVIVNFMKTAPDPLYLLRLLVNIPQDGEGLQTYAQNFTGNYVVAYGVIGEMSDVDSDETYDYIQLMIF